MAKVKGNPGLRPEIDVDSMSYTMRVTADGTKTGKVVAEKTYFISDLPSAIQDRFTVQGGCTIHQQRVSGEDGALARFEAMDATWNRWKEGEWEAERKAPVRKPVEAIIEVLAEEGGHSVASVEEQWKALTDEVRAALRKKFAKKVEAFEKAKLDAKPDLASMV